ncbi:MAG: lysoplasmalogenase [Chloroflexi bacterium]|nr:lysoplasmalogenase [Chloroflexota bacterium]
MGFLLALTLTSAVLDWYAVYKGWKKIEYLVKPLTMVFLFLWLVFSAGLSGALLWFGLGILLSLAGDVFLMFSERWFIAGLAAFLLAHVGYIIGFNQPVPPFNVFGLALAVFTAILAAQLYKKIAAGLVAGGKPGLRGPVLAYTAVISLMLLSAMQTLLRLDWAPGAALAVSAGAALFMFSDVILAWNRFVAPIKNGRVINMASYHLGQIALIVGAVMQFG